MNDQEEIDEADKYLKYFCPLIPNFIVNELNFITILCLILIPIFVLACKYIVGVMLNLCTSKSIHYMPQQPAIKVVKYFNQFVFHLHHSNASYDSIKCTISSEIDCFVVPLWNVPIYNLFKLLQESTLFNLHESITDFTIQSKCGNSSDVFLLHGGKEITKNFQPPQDFDSETVQTSYPRLHYPFVLLMFSKTISNSENHQIVLLVNIVHIPDEVVKLPAHLHQQYVKTSNGYLGVVKKIYPGSFDSSIVGNKTVELCVVCMCQEISVVVIPCGHSCLCRTCFEQCKNCPICRGPTHHYFVSNTVSQR